MNSQKNTLLFMLFLVMPFFTIAQTKFEKEYRIKENEAPAKAVRFIHSAGIDFSEKWYFEENRLGNSIEAKLKHNGKRFSVEFDTLGNLQDIEVETDFDDVAVSLQSKITASLKNTYSKYKIRKMQVQYSGKIDSFNEIMENTAKSNKYNIQYEFVVKGKNNRQWKLFEITFSSAGELISTNEIFLRNTDNLEF